MEILVSCIISIACGLVSHYIAMWFEKIRDMHCYGISHYIAIWLEKIRDMH